MNDLGELPGGEQTFEGIPFKIEDRVIQLGGSNLPRTTLKVEGIGVGLAFNRLHILHSTNWGDYAPHHVWDGTLIGRYILHYEDGEIDHVPIIYGRDMRDWWLPNATQGVTRGSLDLLVAWKGNNEAAQHNGATIRLFLTTWNNPAPDRKVISIDFSSRQHLPTAPFCVAMTVEGKAGAFNFVDLQPRANRKRTDEFHFDAEGPPVFAKPARVYVDEDHGLKVTAPAGWDRWNPAVSAVPGEICRAWSPDGWTGIYLSVQKTGQPVTPQAFLNARTVVTLLDLGAEIHKRQLRTVAGLQAMHLAYSGRGRGTDFGVDGRGPNRPVQHWVAIPRSRDIVHLILVAPEDHSELAEAAFEAMLKTLEFTDSQT